MSFIIGISKPKYFCHFNKPNTLLSKSQAPRSTDMSFKSNSLALTIQEALKLQQIQYWSRTLPSGHSYITTEQFELGKSMGGVVNFRVRAVEGIINVKIDILTNRQQFFRIQSLDRRIFINRALSSAKHAPNNPFFKAAICMAKGIVTLTLPLHYILQVVSMQSSSTLRKTAILRKLIDVMLLEAKTLIGYVLKKDECLSNGVNKGNWQLSRLRQMMNLFKGGWEGNEVMSQKSIRQYKTKQIKSINDLIQNKIPNYPIAASLKLYLFHENDAQLKNQDQCIFNSYQAELVKKISIPSRKVNKYDSNYTYTAANILLHRPDQIKVSPLNSGGFSAIYLAEVEYSFVDISEANEKVKDKKIQKSLMVIKKQIGNSKKGSRNQREKSIIQKMKNSTSYMLNRYYFPVNLPPASKTDIFMDHIPYLTLKDFLHMSRQYFSLQSKLFILLSVVQGLRSINQFDVVHLDLKPSNIMMNAQLGIKLLDFGQSYHPQVQKCKPGFTIPYGCPQIHSGYTHFSVKSDVYSLGIIMFQILYKQYPFYFSDEANLDLYKTDSYLQHWFCYPQGANKLGQASIYQTINLMISRCLSKDENRRPQLLNIALVLQQCINMLQ